MPMRSKLILLGSLYAAQGLSFGFFVQALPVLMREQGYSLAIIGLSALLDLPWALKFLWAPLVDRFGSKRIGWRRTWLIPLQALMTLSMVGFALLEPSTALPMVLLGVKLASLLAATQDIATDALAVDVLEPGERGVGNAVQVGGYRVGMILGGGVMLIVFARAGWEMTFGAMALITALLAIPMLLHREGTSATAPWATVSKGAGEASRSSPSPWKANITYMRVPGVPYWLLALALYKGGDWLAGGMLRPLLVDRGLTIEQIGWLIGTVGFAAALAGAAVGGWGITRLGHHRALVVFGVLQAIAVGGYLLPALGFVNSLVVYAACTLEHFTGGMAMAALFTAMMDTCRRNHAAADYALQSSVLALAAIVPPVIGGYLASAAGYPVLFLTAIAVCGLGVAAVHASFPRVMRERVSGSGIDSVVDFPAIR